MLRNAKGEALKGSLEWRRVGYVARAPGFFPHPHGVPQYEMWLPDPLLLPAPFRVRKGSTQGLWFTVYAAPDAAAGDVISRSLISSPTEFTRAPAAIRAARQKLLAR